MAAAHADAHAVVHYGPACLSPVSRLPVRFVFGRRLVPPAAAALLVRHVLAHAAALAAADTPPRALLLLFDLEYAHAMPALHAAVVGAALAPVPAVRQSGQQPGAASPRPG